MENFVQGVLGLHEFWARNKFVQAKFLLVKLCTSTFLKLRASEILGTCYPRSGVCLKICASEIHASEIRASQGPPVIICLKKVTNLWGISIVKLPNARNPCIKLILSSNPIVKAYL